MQRRAVSLKLEYIEQALIEAEAAARWYANVALPRRFDSALNLTRPKQRFASARRHGLGRLTERGGICCGGFHSASSTAPSRPVSSSSPLRTPVADQATGELGPEPV